MSDNSYRLVVSVIGTLAGAFIFFGGYVAGTHGWWWAGVLVLALFPIINKLISH